MANTKTVANFEINNEKHYLIVRGISIKLAKKTLTGNTEYPVEITGIQKVTVDFFDRKKKTNIELQESTWNAILEEIAKNRPAFNEAVKADFATHTDLETGVTYYTLRNRISYEAWKKVAHLFFEAELDCPDSREWNDSIVLKHATCQPDLVKTILGGK